MQDLTPSHPVGVLELFSTSQQSIRLFADLVIDEIKEGRVDPLRIKALCKSMEAIAEAIDKNTKDEQMKEAAKFGDKPFMNFGCEMHLTAIKTEYDYFSCGDSYWKDLKDQIGVLSNKLKQREEWLRAMTKAEDVRYEDQLETITPPVKKQSMGVKTTIK